MRGSHNISRGSKLGQVKYLGHGASKPGVVGKEQF